ncbi:hypothetical protein RO3G_15923 [Rhizopus delemar RA 99-880]|uniref:Uncharacterized protein n=1 Tax=Rhizopus delemar (strain RA 99-880 / ATCC MYA-4621 / FGSC 9543 / NRRL 43880) TaxID=246409 RepID=I1CRY2_RHIO9|nr:hypothetical protein RO3G_15923 [Rhizopus delemar RA 99-880]|eukprot:EIE91212.1 hypothetical protein RO3G_15923 [Rhizopus delemar RA 99-880]
MGLNIFFASRRTKLEVYKACITFGLRDISATKICGDLDSHSSSYFPGFVGGGGSIW